MSYDLPKVREALQASVNHDDPEFDGAGWSICRDCGDHLGPGCVAVVIDGEAVCFECRPDPERTP